MLETIITILGSSSVTAIITTVINRKSLSIQNNRDNDAVLISRIDFLSECNKKNEERINRLETLACYNVNCEKRV